MDTINFAYWLQGFFELTPENQGISAEQAMKIKQRLALALGNVSSALPLQEEEREPIAEEEQSEAGSKAIGYVIEAMDRTATPNAACWLSAKGWTTNREKAFVYDTYYRANAAYDKVWCEANRARVVPVVLQP